MANVHLWSATVSIDEAAGWTWSFFENTDVALAQELSNNPEMSIAETGWPTVCFNMPLSVWLGSLYWDFCRNPPTQEMSRMASRRRLRLIYRQASCVLSLELGLTTVRPSSLPDVPGDLCLPGQRQRNGILKRANPQVLISSVGI